MSEAKPVRWRPERSEGNALIIGNNLKCKNYTGVTKFNKIIELVNVRLVLLVNEYCERVNVYG
jgi:hypothetical protein